MMTDAKYQCDHSPGSGKKELDLICRGCLMKLVNQKNRLLVIVKQIHEANRTYSGDVEKLLKEIGELDG